MTSISRQLLLPLAALFQIAGSSLPQIYGWGISVGERSNALDTAIIPAGWAFSIWGIIFLWCLIFAGFAATRTAENAKLAERVTLPAIGAFTANGIWGLYTPFFGLSLGSEVIIIIGLFSALMAALIAGPHAQKTSSERFLISAPLGLVAGWLTAASFVGASSVALGLGADVNTEILLAILGAATLFALIIISRGPSLTYSLALFWALWAIVDKNADGGVEIIRFAAMGAIGLILVATLLRLPRTG